MKKSLFITILTLAFISSLFISCKREQPVEEEKPNSATITITSPADSSTYNHGDTVLITGSVVGLYELHGYELTIRNTADSTVLYSKDEHVHGTSFNFNEFWVNNVTDHSNLELEVTAVLDHEGNTATKKVHFHCMP